MNFLKKFSLIILIISFLILLYTFYKSEIIFNSDKRNYYKFYYLISLILICFSIITFFINEKIKIYLIILGISLVISLYLFEGYLTFKEKYLIKLLYKKQTGNEYDTRTKFEIYNDLKKLNNKITVFFQPSQILGKDYSFFPLSGISDSQTILCNQAGYYSIYQSDRYGFNNPNNEWDQKEIEYLLLGDSFTQGFCVNRQNNISSVLKNLSNKSVLNLGLGGNGPLIEYAILREYLKKNVKKVLWIYFEGNDLDNLLNEKKNNILIKYLKDLNFTQNLKFKQNYIDHFLSKTIKEIETKREVEKGKGKDKDTFKFKLIKFIKIYNTRNLIKPEQSPIQIPKPAPAPEFKQILKLTKELVSTNNSKLYFVYLPEFNRYKKNYSNKNYNLVKNIVNELKIPFIDIHQEVFEKEQVPLKLFPFKQNRHYSIEGYKKVAKSIYKLTKD